MFLISLLPLLALIYGHTTLLDSQIRYTWIPQLSIEFHVGIDSLSLLFLYLTTTIIPISLLAIRSDTLTYPNLFYCLIILLEWLLIGFFTAKDLVLFTFFWEAMLLPLYFIINLWGGPQRRYASLKFLIYMIAGSVLMVVAVLSLYVISAKTFNIEEIAKVSETTPHTLWIAAIFLLAFSVKTPLFPFHAWLPDAYTQAPTAGTILLSALLSKAGIYGFFRIGMGLFPSMLKEWSPFFLGFAITGVFYGGLAAWTQKDFKRLLAYSSFSHVNFIMAGFFIWSEPAQIGTLLQVINHGITITGLFLVAGWLEERLGSTAIGSVSGLAHYTPTLCWLTLLFILSAIALPGSNNFIGELLILFALFKTTPWLAVLLGLTIILSAIYMLRWMQKVYFEEASPYQQAWIDLRKREIAITVPLLCLIFWIGIYPAPILHFLTKVKSG